MSDLSYLIAEFMDSDLPTLTARDIVLPEIARKPTVVIGMRRAGKTYLLYQEMQRLLASGVDKRDLLYVNFEDDRLYPLPDTVLDDLLETFFRLNPSSRERVFHLFLDDIQMVPGFPRFARRVVDTLPARMYLTGSSVRLLHSDFAAAFPVPVFAAPAFPLVFPRLVPPPGPHVGGDAGAGPLPDDTRLWAALQAVGGGAWGGCVYDVDKILAKLGR